MIKYERNENIFSFQSENLKVEFSEPRVQAHDEYGACKNEKDILYYYYNVSVQSKKDNGKWKILFSVNTYDFPEILNFKVMLEAMLNEVKIEDYQKADCGEGHIWYTYYLDSCPLCEDYYAISHSILKDEHNDIERDSYTVTVGKALDYSCSEVQSMNFGNLTRTDLNEIYECVKDFVQYSIDETHRINKERDLQGLNAFKIEDGKLYEMSQDKTEVLAVYVPGDEIDEIKVLKGDINSKDFKSTSICKFKIDKFTEDGIVLSSGYEDLRREFRRITEREEIKLSVLIDLFDDVSEDRLKFNEEEIANDFISILSDKEKEEFKTKSETLLFQKWNQAILNRTWMCRDEHNLPKRTENKGNHENVYASIREIIKLIKSKLK